MTAQEIENALWVLRIKMGAALAIMGVFILGDREVLQRTAPQGGSGWILVSLTFFALLSLMALLITALQYTDMLLYRFWDAVMIAEWDHLEDHEEED